MRVRSRTLVVGACAAALLLALVATTPAVAGPAYRADRTAHERTVGFWTKERIAKARPREVRLGDRPTPLRKPTPSPTTPVTLGSQWPDGQGLVYRATGRVLFAMAGQYWICSGSVITDGRADRSVVLTAGHCAYDQANHAFATEWLFIPEFDAGPSLFDCATTPHGCWTADSLVVSAAFAGRNGFDAPSAQADWAFAVLGPGGHDSVALDTTVGSFPISFSSVTAGTLVTALGYPAGAPYDGTQLIYCHGAAGFDPRLQNRTYRLPCSMTGGSSGGPWLRDLTTSGDGGTVMSLDSYTYADAVAMHGPRFDRRTQAAWTAALTTTADRVVP
jgi:V8-like Glu-specific endopeptidase